MATKKRGKKKPAKRKTVKKVPKKKEPSLRMRRAAQALMESNGKSVSAAMRVAGYPDATAKNPQQLTRSKSWKVLMEEFLPRKDLAKVHKSLLKAESTTFIQKKGKIIAKKTPDHANRNRALVTAYKLRGDFAPEKIEISKRKFEDMTNEELNAFIEGAKNVFKKK